MDEPPAEPNWVWWSTRETIKHEIPSATAILETIFAVPLYWWLAIHFETYGFLIFGACVAPLVLMRSEESVALGAKWFSRWEKRRIADKPTWRVVSRPELVFVLVACLLGVVASTLTSCSLATYLAGAGRFIAFVGGIGIGVVAGAIALAVPSGIAEALPLVIPARGQAALIAVGVTSGAFAPALAGDGLWVSTGIGAVGIAMVIAAAKERGILSDRVAPLPVRLAQLLAGLAQVSMALAQTAAQCIGVFIVALVIRIAGTLYHFVQGLFSVTGNFRRLVFCTSPIQEPELIPGLPDTSRLTFARVLREQSLDNNIDADERIYLLFLTIMFLPAWVYRLTLKSTVWVWWPLALIASPPKLARTPAWQYRAMVSTLFGWMAIIGASYTNLAFLITQFVSQLWSHGIPDNPYLTALGYLLVLNWPQNFWPIFVTIGPVLSIVALIWLNRTYAKYRIANEHGYKDLQLTAEKTFPIIEVVQRIQFVMFVLYCSLVIGQAGLYFNSRKCWVPIAPNVQSWSDWLFGEKSPHQKCDHRP